MAPSATPLGLVKQLAAGRGLSVLGREAAAIALALALWQHTGDARWPAAALFVVHGAYIAAAPLAGRLADTRSTRTVLLLCEGARAALLLSLVALLVLRAPSAALIPPAALAAMADAICAASLGACIPRIVSGDELARANALLIRIRTIAYLAGPFAGGALAAVLGPAMAFAVAALTALAAGALAIGCPATPRPVREAGEQSRGAGGARIILSDPVLRAVTAAWCLARIGCAVEATAAVPLGNGAGRSAIGAGILVAAFGGGDLLGATIAPALSRRATQPALIAGGIAVIGAGLLCTALAPVFALAVLGVAIAGIGDGVSVVGEQCVLQERAPEGQTGRVLAAYEATLTTAGMTALLPAGVLVATLGPRPAYALAALPCLAAALLCGKAAHANRKPAAERAAATVSSDLALAA